MELSDIESFHFLYRALWQPEPGSTRHKINMMDTIIFQHGHPFRWIFTSEKTGEVLKKNKCKLKASDIAAALKKRSFKLRGKRNKYRDDSKFACVWFRTEGGSMSFRLLDEAELHFVLGDRTYSQYISAIQVFFEGFPLKGCGIFEHCYSKWPDRPALHKTFEFVHMPKSADVFDLNTQGYIRDSASDGQGLDVSKKIDENETPRQERLVITETQNDILKLTSCKVIKLIEGAVGSKITRASFLFYFNTAWTPFIVACTGIHVETKNMTILNRYSNQMALAAPSSKGKSTAQLDVDVDAGDIVVAPPQNSRSPTHRMKHPKRTTSDIYGSSEDLRVKGEIEREVAEQQQCNSPIGKVQHAPLVSEWVPPPSSNIPRSKIPYEKTEASPDKNSELKRKFGGKRHSVLDNFIALSSKGLGATGTKPGRQKLNNQADTGGRKTYLQLTNTKCARIKGYPDQVRGGDSEVWKDERTRRRPISAPHLLRRKCKSRVNEWGDEDTDPMREFAETHGLEAGGVRSSGLQKKLPLQGDTCFGDYCNLLTPLVASVEDTDEYLASVGMMKVKGADGVLRLKALKAEQQITCKAVLLSRAESKFIGGEVVVIENIESYEYSENDIINACAKQHILRVAEKCRKDAFTSLIKGGLKRVPNIGDLQATAFVYRNLIYNDALSQVHPTRFYYTVPCCRICYFLYHALDMHREDVIYRPVDTNPLIKAIRMKDGDDICADIVKKARASLRSKADQIRSTKSARKKASSQQAEYDAAGVYNDDDSGEEQGGIPSSYPLETYMEEEEDSNASKTIAGQIEQNSEPLEYKGSVQNRCIRRAQSASSSRRNSSYHDLERRKSELLGGATLGTGIRGCERDNVEGNKPSDQEVMRELVASKSKGSMASWADLLAATKETKQRGRRKSDDHGMSWSRRRASRTSPDVIERRMSVLADRKADRMQWKDSLRDPTVHHSPVRDDTRRSRPSSATATNQSRPFAVRNGSDLKTLSGTYVPPADAPKAIRPRSANNVISKIKELRVTTPAGCHNNTDENCEPSFEQQTGNCEVSAEQQPVTSSGPTVSDRESGNQSGQGRSYDVISAIQEPSERQRLLNLRDSILLSRGLHSVHVIRTAKNISNTDFAYGDVPFTDAQCLPHTELTHEDNEYDDQQRFDITEGEENLRNIISSSDETLGKVNHPKVLPISAYFEK